MMRVLLKGSVRLLALLFAISVVAFLLVTYAPIDPVQAYIGSGQVVSATQRAEIAQYLGVDLPPLTRYVTWLQGALQGDFGTSTLYRQSVVSVIGEKAGNSLALLLSAWVLSGAVGFGLGMVMGTWPDSPWGKGLKRCCLTLASMPTFFVGMVCLMVFSVWLNWFPIGFSVPIGVLAEDVTWWQRVQHLVLPCLTLTVVSVSNIALHTREKLQEVMASDYVLFARTRGYSTWQIFKRHGLRNMALPFVTLQFASLGELFGGSLLAETVFSYPGLGSAVVEAGLGGDGNLLLGISLCSGVLVFCANATANVICACIDPHSTGGAHHG